MHNVIHWAIYSSDPRPICYTEHRLAVWRAPFQVLLGLVKLAACPTTHLPTAVEKIDVGGGSLDVDYSVQALAWAFGV